MKTTECKVADGTGDVGEEEAIYHVVDILDIDPDGLPDGTHPVRQPFWEDAAYYALTGRFKCKGSNLMSRTRS